MRCDDVRLGAVDPVQAGERPMGQNATEQRHHVIQPPPVFQPTPINPLEVLTKQSRRKHAHYDGEMNATRFCTTMRKYV